MRNTKEKTAKDYAVGSLIAAVAAAGLALGALFSSPEDMLSKDVYVPPAFEISDSMICDNDGDSDLEASTDDVQEKKQKGLRAVLRRLFMRLPAGVRAFAGVPMWIIGRVLLALFGAIFNSVLSPILMTALKYLCIAGLILAAVTVPVKAFIPEMPLKKIVTGKRVAISAAVSALFGLCGVLVGLFYPEAMKTYEIVESGLITIIVAFAALGLLKIKNRKKREKTG